MARFTKLKWVPMLIRAYYDAQRQLESRQTNQQSAGTVAVGGGSTNAEVAGKVDVEKNDSKPGRLQNKSQTPHAKRHSRMQTTKIAHKHTGRVTTQSNMRNRLKLLQELQRTNQKLEELQSIKTQLKEFGITIDSFSKEIERISENRSSAKDALEQTMQGPGPHPQQQNAAGIHPNHGQPPLNAGPNTW